MKYFIMTGDKRAVIELAKTSRAETMAGKIICLEEIFLKLLEVFQFEELKSKIISAKYCEDKVLRFCFNQPDITRSKVAEGLKSYLNDLKSNTGSLLYSR